MITYFFPPTFSGGSRQALSVAKALRAYDIDCFFIGVNIENAPSFEDYEGFSVYRLKTVNRKRFCYLIYMLKVCRILYLKRNLFDVVHFHSIKPFSFLVQTLARILNKPVVLKLTLIGNDDPITLKKKSFLWRLEGRLYKHLDRIICTSTAIKESCVRERIPDLKLVSIPCGTDTKIFRPAKVRNEVSKIRISLGLPAESFIAAFVGYISTRKGCDLLLDAWQEIQSRNIKAYLLLVGPYRHILENKNSETNLKKKLQFLFENPKKKKIIFVGDIPLVQVALYLRASDCLIFPSHNEGFGTAVIEAMACGLPVICTRIPKITEDIVDNGKDGIILNNRDPKYLADTIQAIFENNELRQRLSLNAVKKVHEKFSINLVAEKHSKLYKSLLNQL